MQLVQTITVGSGGAASIQFSSIPQGGTDLFFLINARNAGSDSKILHAFNGSTASFSNVYMLGTGSARVAGTDDQRRSGTVNTNSSTGLTFSSTSLLIPNYTLANNKSWSSDSVYENFASEAYQTITNGVWANTAAITSVTFTLGNGTNFVQDSFASLYLITKA
jgi:hypothetical protein